MPEPVGILTNILGSLRLLLWPDEVIILNLGYTNASVLALL